ncbi:MAG: NifU family protein [Chthonomonas sp.]|nr:NifU family protein [Chthonomonas sp.]
MFALKKRKVIIGEDVPPETVTLVEEVMADVRTYARSHGGDIVLTAIPSEREIRVKLKGACAFCPLSTVTLRVGIERRLKSELTHFERIRID